MKCSKCKFKNPEGVNFCVECGAKLEISCPKCGYGSSPSFKYCGECGHNLTPTEQTSDKILRAEGSPPFPVADETSSDVFPIVGERKYVTVLFSDLSGYTTLSEKLDPEELKEITSRIFSEISKTVSKYDGFIEKYAGDAVMALFGVPRAHEDDPIRAIKVAQEIHELIEAISPEIENRIGQSISMHSGINSGLVVTGELDMLRGTHGVAGDTVNLASRLSRLAKAGEVLVDTDTCRQAEGLFVFESLEPKMIKGKKDPVQIYKVLSQKEKPVTIRRLSGLRANLVGRKEELAELGAAVENLREGKGSIFSISGEAGTGKSRLVEEFKSTLNLNEIQWLEGHAYPYAQNITYFPLIDLLNRVFQIEEGDPPERIGDRIESGVEALLGQREDVVPYLGNLYSLSYPGGKDVSPEFWRSSLQAAIQAIFSALAERALTIFFLEDLHWADPSFVELMRRICLEIRQPAIFLCVYRPAFWLFTSHQLKGLGKIYHEIQLKDLSFSEEQDMLASLLKTENIPSYLKRLVQKKAEGNPFYLEELVNSLIESGTLCRNNGGWEATKPISESDISSTIYGVISGRLDRLEKETKQILQEASVIGRAFLYKILKKITKLENQIDKRLSVLEQLDFLRTRSLQPDLEYMFKHALTQEVVYNGLLKSERRVIHERIGLVMEQVFNERLSEFYETLAFHFTHGKSLDQAVDYLMKSGEKSLARYALEEAHQYFKDAFELLNQSPELSGDEVRLLIDLLIKWAFIYYYRGDFIGLIDLFKAHEGMAESLDDKARLGMFNAWYGFALDMTGYARESFKKLLKALELGEETGNQNVIGYACTWLTWTCWDLGLLDKAIMFGERAQEIARTLKSDHYLYFKSLAGIGQTCYSIGDRKRAIQAGSAILEYGKINSNIRSMTLGQICIAYGHLLSGDFQKAIEIGHKAIQISVDPFYSQYVRVQLGFSFLLNEQFKEAEDALLEVLDYSQKYNVQILGLFAKAFLGVTYIAKGRSNIGLKMLEESILTSVENGRKTVYTILEYTLGKVYLQLAAREAPIDISFIIKNIGFLAKNLITAYRRAEEHFNKAIDAAQEAGAKGVLGQIYLDYGLLKKLKGKKEEVREYMSKALQIFEQMDAKVYMQQAKDVLDSLD